MHSHSPSLSHTHIYTPAAAFLFDKEEREFAHQQLLCSTHVQHSTFSTSICSSSYNNTAVRLHSKGLNSLLVFEARDRLDPQYFLSDNFSAFELNMKRPWKSYTHVCTQVQARTHVKEPGCVIEECVENKMSYLHIVSAFGLGVHHQKAVIQVLLGSPSGSATWTRLWKKVCASLRWETDADSSQMNIMNNCVFIMSLFGV